MPKVVLACVSPNNRRNTAGGLGPLCGSQPGMLNERCAGRPWEGGPAGLFAEPGD